MTTMYPFMEPSHVASLKLSEPGYSSQQYSGLHSHHPAPHPAHYSRDFLFRREMAGLEAGAAHHPASLFPHPADPFPALHTADHSMTAWSGQAHVQAMNNMYSSYPNQAPCIQ